MPAEFCLVDFQGSDAPLVLDHRRLVRLRRERSQERQRQRERFADIGRRQPDILFIDFDDVSAQPRGIGKRCDELSRRTRGRGSQRDRRDLPLGNSRFPLFATDHELFCRRVERQNPAIEDRAIAQMQAGFFRLDLCRSFAIPPADPQAFEAEIAARLVGEAQFRAEFGHFFGDCQIGKRFSPVGVDKASPRLLIEKDLQMNASGGSGQHCQPRDVRGRGRITKDDQIGLPGLDPKGPFGRRPVGVDPQGERETGVLLPRQFDLDRRFRRKMNIPLDHGIRLVRQHLPVFVAPLAGGRGLPAGKSIGPHVNEPRSVLPAIDPQDPVPVDVHPAGYGCLHQGFVRPQFEEFAEQHIPADQLETELAFRFGQFGGNRKIDRVHRAPGERERRNKRRRLPAQQFRIVGRDQPACRLAPVYQMQYGRRAITGRGRPGGRPGGQNGKSARHKPPDRALDAATGGYRWCWNTPEAARSWPGGRQREQVTTHGVFPEGAGGDRRRGPACRRLFYNDLPASAFNVRRWVKSGN
jgi:hypothetical protein